MKKQTSGSAKRAQDKTKTKKKKEPIQEVKTMGQRLRHYRKLKGYSSYEDFAFENDISTSQYFAYEKGQNLEFETLVKILKALKVSLKEFFSEGFD